MNLNLIQLKSNLRRKRLNFHGWHKRTKGIMIWFRHFLAFGNRVHLSFSLSFISKKKQTKGAFSMQLMWRNWADAAGCLCPPLVLSSKILATSPTTNNATHRQKERTHSFTATCHLIILSSSSHSQPHWFIVFFNHFLLFSNYNWHEICRLIIDLLFLCNMQGESLGLSLWFILTRYRVYILSNTYYYCIILIIIFLIRINKKWNEAIAILDVKFDLNGKKQEKFLADLDCLAATRILITATTCCIHKLHRKNWTQQFFMTDARGFMLGRWTWYSHHCLHST